MKLSILFLRFGADDAAPGGDIRKNPLSILFLRFPPNFYADRRRHGGASLSILFLRFGFVALSGALKNSFTSFNSLFEIPLFP
jgi:hypothetical protein